YHVIIRAALPTYDVPRFVCDGENVHRRKLSPPLAGRVRLDIRFQVAVVLSSRNEAAVFPNLRRIIMRKELSPRILEPRARSAKPIPSDAHIKVVDFVRPLGT